MIKIPSRAKPPRRHLESEAEVVCGGRLTVDACEQSDVDWCLLERYTMGSKDDITPGLDKPLPAEAGGPAISLTPTVGANGIATGLKPHSRSSKLKPSSTIFLAVLSWG